jgi:hypothetical protein
MVQVQSHCRQACDHTRHCKRVRFFDDGHVLVLLGPSHLVPDSFWIAAKLLLEPCSSSRTESSCCLQVPVVTTVPTTQVSFLIFSAICKIVMSKEQEQLIEWGRTWPISHRQPGAVLPPPPLSRGEIDLMYLHSNLVLESVSYSSFVLTQYC